MPVYAGYYAMLVKLRDFICAAEHGDDSIAGYLEPGVRSSANVQRFVHWRSSQAMLPAFVNCLEDGGDMRRIYTNHEQAPWVRPRGPGVKRRDTLRADDGDGSLMIEPVLRISRRWPARVASAGGPAPLSGGLHAAALSSRRRPDTTEGGGGHDASGLSRSLRYYALATRTLIAFSATSEFTGVHDHVGAILVSDAGAILAAGINTGSYRHAEVSLLLSWFRDHPQARTLPGKSIVFSTLTPCRQCTRYLSLAKAPDTLILFDEADAGRSGRVGERIAEQVGVEIGQGLEGDICGATSGHTSATREAERRAIRNDGTSGASRIDRSRAARRTLLDAAFSIDQVAGRALGQDCASGPGEQQIEAAVLAYLAKWIRGAVRVE